LTAAFFEMDCEITWVTGLFCRTRKKVPSGRTRDTVRGTMNAGDDGVIPMLEPPGSVMEPQRRLPPVSVDIRRKGASRAANFSDFSGARPSELISHDDPPVWIAATCTLMFGHRASHRLHRLPTTRSAMRQSGRSSLGNASRSATLALPHSLTSQMIHNFRPAAMVLLTVPTGLERLAIDQDSTRT
jgi:hypothetical protein